jgi:hypothetical protein
MRMLASRVVRVVFCLVVSWALCTPAFAVAVGTEPFWRIDETFVPFDSQNPDLGGEGRFAVTNMHPFSEIVLFGAALDVTFEDFMSGLVVEPETADGSGWIGELVIEPIWDGSDLATTFGASWDETFPGYDFAAVYQHDAGGIGGIGPGTSVEFLNGDPLFAYTASYPASPTAIVLADGTAHFGPDGTNNPFSVIVPEPATFGLVSIGLLGLALRRRRK